MIKRYSDSMLLIVGAALWEATAYGCITGNIPHVHKNVEIGITLVIGGLFLLCLSYCVYKIKRKNLWMYFGKPMEGEKTNDIYGRRH